MLSSFAISLIRTYVPLAVGAVIAWLAVTLHVVVDPASEASLGIALVTAVTAAYYTLVRFLEKRWPWFGALLGKPAEPAYSAPSSSASVTADDVASAASLADGGQV